MKKISVILVFSLIVVLLTSCMSNDAPSGAVSTEQTTETAENNEVVPEKSFISEKETLMSKICGLYGLDIVLFKKIQEGAFVYAGSVTELPDTISSEQVMLAKRLISYDPELFFVKDIELEGDGLSVNIYYNTEQIQAEKERQELTTKINSIVSSLAKYEFTPFEKALWIYSYLSKNIWKRTNTKKT